jgi:hypothetical protein
MNYRLLLKLVFAISILTWASGCASATRIRAPKNPDPVIEGEVTADKAQQALQLKLTRELDYLRKNAEKYKDQVLTIQIDGSTYYYKYYDEFPEPADQMQTTVTPTGTLSPAYEGTVKLRKIRYQTRYVKSHGKAADDDDFIRDEGLQENSYSFDGKAWQLKRSVFEITKTSIYREDQWVASQGRIKRIEEEKPEYFVDKLRTLFGLLD